MKKILSALVQISKSSILRNIGKFIEIVVASVFYMCLVISIVLGLGSILQIKLYSFASRELFLSFEIIMLMILLYFAKQHRVCKSIYRILWIIVMVKIFFIVLMLPNIQKVIDFEDCADIEYCKSFVHTSINQTECLRANGAWNVDDSACDYRYNLNGNCEKRPGNWIYPSICTE